jgi:hypothetical protein
MFMKQMKFLLVALMAVVMSVSVTSCMKGDDNTTGSGYTVAKVKSNMLTSISFTTIDGYTLLAGANSSLTNATSGDFVYLAYTYDTETDVDAASKTIKITIAGAQIVSGNSVPPITVESDNEIYKSNRPVITISDGALSPLMFDNDNLILPIQYYAKEDASKHKFTLVYYTDKLKGNKNGEDKNDGLTLYLRHNSEETDEATHIFSYKTFDISGAIDAYDEEYNSYPSKIYIEIEKSSNTDGKVPETTTSTSFDYTHK